MTASEPAPFRGMIITGWKRYWLCRDCDGYGASERSARPGAQEHAISTGHVVVITNNELVVPGGVSTSAGADHV